MIAVMWAYEGWAYLAFAAGEVRDPARTLPRAFIYGTLGITAVYLLVNVGYFVALPLAAISGETRVAEKAMTAVVGPFGATFVAAIVCLSTLGCNMSARAGRLARGIRDGGGRHVLPVRGARAPEVPARRTAPCSASRSGRAR